MLELGLLTGPLGTGEHYSVSLTLLPHSSLAPWRLAFHKFGILKNHLTPVVPRVYRQKNFQTQFSSTPSSFYDLLFQSKRYT